MERKSYMASWVRPRKYHLFHSRRSLSCIRAHRFKNRRLSEVLSWSDTGKVVYLPFVQCQFQQPTTVQLRQGIGLCLTAVLCNLKPQSWPMSSVQSLNISTLKSACVTYGCGVRCSPLYRGRNRVACPVTTVCLHRSFEHKMWSGSTRKPPSNSLLPPAEHSQSPPCLLEPHGREFLPPEFTPRPPRAPSLPQKTRRKTPRKTLLPLSIYVATNKKAC